MEDTHVLMACVCEYNDGESSQDRNRASPLEDSDVSAVSESVALDVVGYDENNEIRNRAQSNDARVL